MLTTDNSFSYAEVKSFCKQSPGSHVQETSLFSTVCKDVFTDCFFKTGLRFSQKLGSKF